MKVFTAISLITLSILFNCTPKETTLIDLPGEIIWQKGDKIIKSVLDSVPKVIIRGIKRENKYSFGNSFIAENEADLVLSGEMKVLGDLNGDGIPEFILEDIAETADSVYGWRIVASIYANGNIQSVTQVQVATRKNKCKDIIGSNENYSFDNTKEGGPYLVLTGTYGYAEGGNCDSYQRATTKDFFTLSPGQSWLVQSFNCVVTNKEVNLSRFYKLGASKLKYLPRSPGNFYHVYNLTNKLIACGNDNNDGLSHLEKVAGVKAVGSATKRSDLMPFIEEEFKNINPFMVKWINDHLIPSPDQIQANGLTYQFIYDLLYKGQFRKMVALKIIIEQQGREALVRDYASIATTKQYIESEERVITKDNYETYGYLESKFNEMQRSFLAAGFDTQYLEATDYGFLMRRMLDGSEPEIWNLTKSIVQQYDAAWFQQTLVEKEWNGVIEIDSATYFQNRILSGADSIIIGKEAIPEGIAIENGAGITITCSNGKEVTFTNNTGVDVSESHAEYKLKGYWPKEEMVLIRYMGWEEGGTLLVDLKTGKEDYRNWELYPSKDGQYMAEAIDEMGYQAILLQKKEESKWVKINEYSDQYLKDGFWLEGTFYFEGDHTYFTIGELVL